mmetsp:Transcript_13146/g.19376  ORF Transcript_13146/g.19376 Transcript_13146/m.19376 type:complete len:169 (-) Transcript_13146:144-650(-)
MAPSSRSRSQSVLPSEGERQRLENRILLAAAQKSKSLSAVLSKLGARSAVERKKDRNMASVSSSDRNEANHCLGADDLAGYAGHGDDNLVVDDSDDLGRDRLDGLVGYDVCHDDESGNGLEDTGLGDDESTYSAGETKKVQKHSFVSVDVGCDGREEDVDDIDESHGC